MKSKNQISDAVYNNAILEDHASSLRSFKNVRDNRRIFKALMEYIATQGDQKIFSAILRKIIIGEKTYLNSILKAQLKKLKEIDAPQDIIKSKKKEVFAVLDAVSGYSREENDDLFAIYMQNMEKESKRDLLDLTANFAGESSWPLNLGHVNADDLDWKYELLRT